jgi:formyltetrahydrofolate-dependent phosphoribosylglycinamide formyltransferase
MSKTNLAVFASTRGTDLQAIIDAIEAGSLNEVDLKFVLSDKKDCYALDRAKNHGFKVIFVDPKGKTREEFDKECLRHLKEEKIDLVLLLGYMRIVSDILVDAYRNKIMNIHPSLLPKYAGGMNRDIHREVLKNKDEESGCTLFFIDGGVDTGKIISQARIKINPDETVESLKKRVQEQEKILILRAIKGFAREKEEKDSKAALLFGRF